MHFITDSIIQFVVKLTPQKSLSFQFLCKLIESAGIVKQELAGGYGHQKHCVRLLLTQHWHFKQITDFSLEGKLQESCTTCSNKTNRCAHMCAHLVRDLVRMLHCMSGTVSPKVRSSNTLISFNSVSETSFLQILPTVCTCVHARTYLPERSHFQCFKSKQNFFFNTDFKKISLCYEIVYASQITSNHIVLTFWFFVVFNGL